MNNYFSLLKVFLRSIAMSDIKDKKKRLLFNILLFFVVIFIFLPFVIFCGTFVYGVTDMFNEIGYPTVGFELMCVLISVFTFIFSFNVVLNQLYFSDDIENILALPIKPYIVVASKLSACFVIENIMQFFVLFASLLGFSFALKLNFINILIGVAGVITLPIISMIYCALISIVIMYFSKYIKNKQTIRKSSILFVVVVLSIFAIFMLNLQDFNFEDYIQNIATDNRSIFNLLQLLFPHIKYFVNSIYNLSFFDFLIYIVINIIFVVALFVLGNFLYLDGVIDLTSRNTNTVFENNKFINHIEKKNIFISYLSKESKILFRSPVFFVNCILINFIWPIFVYVIYKLSIKSITFKSLISMASTDNFLIMSLITILGISILVPSLNSVASSSFSREGKSFYFLKYIPISLKIQCLIKLSFSFIVSFGSIFIFTTIFFIVLKVSMFKILLFDLVSVLCVLLICMIGLFVDSIQPKLVWDDEINSLRENYNTFVVMGIALLLFVLFCGGSYILFYFHFCFKDITVVALCLLLIFNMVLFLITYLSSEKNLIEQEDF